MIAEEEIYKGKMSF